MTWAGALLFTRIWRIYLASSPAITTPNSKQIDICHHFIIERVVTRGGGVGTVIAYFVRLNIQRTDHFYQTVAQGGFLGIPQFRNERSVSCMFFISHDTVCLSSQFHVTRFCCWSCGACDVYIHICWVQRGGARSCCFFTVNLLLYSSSSPVPLLLYKGLFLFSDIVDRIGGVLSRSWEVILL